ncbi:glyoxalase/bleomycin resistance/dioxygenase family protein (plasmid) [Acaryochloris sp. CCMEE 5410]|nr:glyoxalase/bleomycin resistance/dioxygenase family protein [Acaryochloris sp. CCMEE 5410]
MYFVSDRHAAAEWYSCLFDIEITWLENLEHFFIRVGDQEVWFHQSDSKVPSGAAGHVTYWQVTDFDVVLERAIHLGAKLYRGPLDRQDGNYMCQVMDPDGNLIGLIGPRYEDNGAGASI